MRNYYFLMAVLSAALVSGCGPAATVKSGKMDSKAAMAAEGETVTVCRHSGKVRRIAVERGGGDYACRVKYTKEDGETSYPWSASNQADYCDGQAEGLVQRHEEEWGWTCSLEQ